MFGFVLGATHGAHFIGTDNGGGFLLLLFRKIGVNGELLGFGFWFGADVVAACLETLGPPIKVHAGEFLEIGVLNKDVEALGLTDKSATICRQVNQGFLFDLPYRLVQLL